MSSSLGLALSQPHWQEIPPARQSGTQATINFTEGHCSVCKQTSSEGREAGNARTGTNSYLPNCRGEKGQIKCDCYLGSVLNPLAIYLSVVLSLSLELEAKCHGDHSHS